MKILTTLVILGGYVFAQPSWIDNPTDKNYIGAVGIVKSKLDRRVATIKARASLLESITVELSSNSKLTKSKDDSGNYSKSFSQEIIQTAKGKLSKSFVKDTYTQDDGTFYVWVVVER